jgi:2-methylcitrate dehydratase PrpD
MSLEPDTGPKFVGPGSTLTIAEFITGVQDSDIPDKIVHQAKRTLINLMAVSLAAAFDEPSAILARRIEAEGSAPGATVIGRGLRTSPASAALLNGYLAHLYDYDDTHFPTVLHPSAPVWPAVLALAEQRGLSGRETLTAFVLGAEVACRVATSVHPWHYDQGWHITGTAGAFGAAAGAGKVLGLTAAQMVHALGVAGTQASGVREAFGSHTKALHPAKAASNGLQAALLAQDGFTGPEQIIEGRRGFWAVLSPGGHSKPALLEGLGQRWELERNGLKPYANGVVSHPIQDAIISLRNIHGITPDQVSSITARVHPLVLELMNRPAPTTGLEAKFSFQHCAAAALVDGAGHPAQFTDERVNDPIIAMVRSKVSASADPSIEEDEVSVTLTLGGGRTVETRVEHATGSPSNPMTDAALEDKFSALASAILPREQAEGLLNAVWTLDEAAGLSALIGLMVRPEEAGRS